MNQREAVIKVMEENGGYATLSYLYEKVLKIPQVSWKTKTPFASIRRIVQEEKYFFKIKPGLWALKDWQSKLPKDIMELIEENREVTNIEKSSHSYYQGMLVEIGNMKGYKTYIPNQDKNKKYLERTLKEISSIDEIYNFTYEDVIKKVKSIDVFWFNKRKFPACVFEVEYSTDFRNSLLKFVELQDFNVNMYVVSDENRKREFESKKQYVAFSPIEDKIKFLSYEKLAQWHSKTYEQRIIGSKL